MPTLTLRLRRRTHDRLGRESVGGGVCVGGGGGGVCVCVGGVASCVGGGSIVCGGGVVVFFQSLGVNFFFQSGE